MTYVLLLGEQEASPTLGCSIEISRDSASEGKLTNRREKKFFNLKKKLLKKV